jgi:hypothetical protein
MVSNPFARSNLPASSPTTYNDENVALGFFLTNSGQLCTHFIATELIHGHGARAVSEAHQARVVRGGASGRNASTIQTIPPVSIPQ